MRRLGLAAIICAVSSFCQAGDLTVYAPGNSREAVSEAIAQFEGRTGKKIDVVFAGPADMRERLDRGDAFDVLINNASLMDKYEKNGSLKDWTSFGGVAAVLVYRQGAEKPDVSTLTALKTVVERAKTISHSDFKLGGSSAAFYQAQLKSLGIEDMAEAKAIKTETGKGAVPVSDGRAEIGIAQSSELVGFANVASTRLLPSDPKGMTVLQAAVSSSAKAPALAHDFITAVTAPGARKLRVKWGFVDE